MSEYLNKDYPHSSLHSNHTAKLAEKRVGYNRLLLAEELFAHESSCPDDLQIKSQSHFQIFKFHSFKIQ